MSQSFGEVLDVIGAIVGHFEYNGTVDVALAKIFATAQERYDSWRKDQLSPCACYGVDVTLVSEGFMWDGRACLDHGFIVHGTSPIYGREDDDLWSTFQKRSNS